MGVAGLIYNTEGIVIRSIPYGETHAIILLLTPTGTVSAMARGAKRPQSKLRAGTQLCVEGVYTLYQNTGMGNVQQFELKNSRRPLREHLDLAAYAAYFCELVSSSAEERPNGSSFQYREFLAVLDRLALRSDEPSDISRIWEAKILRTLGAAPNWEQCAICGRRCESSTRYSPADGGFICDECSQTANRRSILVPRGLPILLNRMTKAPMERLGQIRLTEPTRRALLTVLRAQLTEFAGLSLKSASILDSLDIS